MDCWFDFSDSFAILIYRIRSSPRFDSASARVETGRVEAGSSPMSYWVYILKSVNYQKSYVGSTDNMTRRLNEHNNGYSTWSRRYMPWIKVYGEECDSLQKARSREKYFKSAAGRRYIKKLGIFV